jgi:hypothetical protein
MLDPDRPREPNGPGDTGPEAMGDTGRAGAKLGFTELDPAEPCHCRRPPARKPITLTVPIRTLLYGFC